MCQSWTNVFLVILVLATAPGSFILIFIGYIVYSILNNVGQFFESVGKRAASFGPARSWFGLGTIVMLFGVYPFAFLVFAIGFLAYNYEKSAPSPEEAAKRKDVEALRRQLAGMRQSQLRERAIADGVDKSSMAKADDADDTKAALIKLILEKAAAKAEVVVAQPIVAEAVAVRQIHVTVPEGSSGGSQITIAAPDGQQFTVVVPEGLRQGAHFIAEY